MNGDSYLRSIPEAARAGLRQFISPVMYQWKGFGQGQYQVAILFIDVAGFTNLSEALAQLGPEGAEILERSIARYFDALLDVIEQFRGLPIKISGDALTVVFPDFEGEFRGTVLRALACADALRTAGLAAARVSTPGGVIQLAHKVGAGAGALIAGTVGDPSLRSELVFAGAALEGAVAAEHHAKAGEVWVAPAMASIVGQSCWWTHIDPAGYCRMGGNPSLELARVPASPLPVLDHDELDAALARNLALIPSAVREQAEKGTIDYLCRHQSLAVIFAGCPGMVLDRPESLHQLDAHYRQMQNLITHYGGFLSEFEAGDKGAKLIILFGAPTTLENPCEQAARCAEAMQQSARTLGIVQDQRLGLSTGRLYVGRIGCRSLVKYSALGDRMNLAARLMTNAGPWTVLAEKYSVEHASPAVRWGARRELRVKGKDEPVSVCALKLAHPSQGRERRGRGIIGRQLERRVLDRAFKTAMEGRGGSIVLSGPPGIGKTRLVEAVRRVALDREGCRIVRWDGSASGIHPSPLSAWRPMLLDLMEARAGSPGEPLLERFRRWHAGLPADLRGSASLLASILEIPWPIDPVLEKLPAERLVLVRIRGLVECVAHESRQTPRLWVLDNAERLDDASIQALDLLGPMLEQLPMLLILAHRPFPAERAEVLKAFHQHPAVQRLELKSMSASETSTLAARRLKVRQLDPELEALLLERATGNPLLVESWIDVLKDHRQIAVQDGVAFLDGSASIQTLPDRLETLILTQFERLPPDAQVTVRVASVIGPTLTPQEVSAIHPEGLSRPVVMAHLHFAAEAGLLHYDRNNAPRMFFSRQEVLDTIHDSLPFHLRRMLHARRVHHLLASMPETPSGDMAVLLAHHHVYIEDPEAQRRYFTQAMETSKQRYDHRGTVLWANRVVEASDKLNDQTGFLKAAPYLETALRLLGEASERTRIISLWVKAAELARETRSLVEALKWQARATQRTGDTRGAMTALDRSLALARELGDPNLLADVLVHASSVYGEAGLSQLALEASDEALRGASQVDPSRLFHLLFGRGFALTTLGRAAEAYQAYQQALAISQESGLVWEQAILQGNMALELCRTGHPEEGHAAFMRSLELKRKVGDRLEVGLDLMNVGYSFFQLGDLPKARAYTDDGLRLLTRVGYFRGEVIAIGNLGEIQWLSGDLDEAEHSYQRARALLAQRPHGPLEVELILREGELALTRRGWDEARAAFDKALERARAGGMEGFKFNALEGLAEQRLRQGDLAGAQQAIDMALPRIEVEPMIVTFPQRIWWRAALVAQAMGRLEEARRLNERAFELLEQEQLRLRSFAARNRLVRAFPWNREILRLRKELAKQIRQQGSSGPKASSAGSGGEEELASGAA